MFVLVFFTLLLMLIGLLFCYCTPSSPLWSRFCTAKHRNAKKGTGHVAEHELQGTTLASQKAQAFRLWDSANKRLQTVLVARPDEQNTIKKFIFVCLDLRWRLENEKENNGNFKGQLAELERVWADLKTTERIDPVVLEKANNTLNTWTHLGHDNAAAVKHLEEKVRDRSNFMDDPQVVSILHTRMKFAKNKRRIRAIEIFYAVFAVLCLAIFLSFAARSRADPLDGGHVFQNFTTPMGDRSFLRAGGFGSTFIQPPTQYDTRRNLHHKQWVPVIYGIMHVCLFIFSLLPVFFARGFWQYLSMCIPRLHYILPIDEFRAIHKTLAWLLLGLLALGAVIWLLLMGLECFRTLSCSCLAFDVGDGNPLRAVFVLRIIVWIAFFGLMPLMNFVVESPRFCLPVVRKWWYEICYYIHLVSAYVVFIMALLSRFEVFYVSLIGWGLYFLSNAWERLYCNFSTELIINNGNHLPVSSRVYHNRGVPVALRVIIRRPQPKRFSVPKAGQWVYLQIGKNDCTWHPFSLANGEGNDFIELLMNIHTVGGEKLIEPEPGLVTWSVAHPTWTYNLYRHIALRKKQSLYSENFAVENKKEQREVAKNGCCGGLFSKKQKQKDGLLAGSDTLPCKIMGPYGASFDKCLNPEFSASVVIGAGTGLSSALSALRQCITLRQQNQANIPQKVWFVWVTRNTDDLVRCWHTLFTTLNEARHQRILVPQASWDGNSKCLDWLSVTMFISQASDEDLKAVKQDFQEDYEHGRQEAMKRAAMSPASKKSVSKNAVNANPDMVIEVPAGPGEEEQKRLPPEPDKERILLDWLTCPNGRLIPCRPTLDHWTKMFVFMQAEVDDEFRKSGVPSKKMIVSYCGPSAIVDTLREATDYIGAECQFVADHVA